MKLKITQLIDHRFITLSSGGFLEGWFCINHIDGTATKDILKIDGPEIDTHKACGKTYHLIGTTPLIPYIQSNTALV